MALAADTAQLIVALRLDDRGFNSKLNAAAGSLRAMDSGLSQMGRGAGQVAGGLARMGTMAATVAAGGLFAVTKWAIDTETAFAGVQKTVDETATTSYERLNDQLRELNRLKPQSFQDLAQIGEFGGQLGVSADNLSSFVDTVSDFLVAVPQMGLEEAAFGLQRIQVLTKAGDESLDNIASTVVELGNTFATTESAIIATTERFASQATAIGLSTQASLGLSTALTALGGEPQEAGTSMQRLFQNINLALAEGGERAELFAEVSGQSAAAFRKSWEEDAEGTLLRFLSGLGDTNLSAIEQTAILDELGLADARLGKNVLNLANNMDTTERALRSANAEWRTNTALSEEAQKRYDTLASKLAVLKDNFIDAGVTIGNEVMPVVKELADEFVTFLNKPETQANIRAFAQDLGEGVRGIVSDLKSTDWTPLINTMKGAVDIARSGIELFNGLPGPVKQLALATIIGNKLTGGALTDVAKGFGNLFSGAIKIAFIRGTSPLNPMWVQSVGGIGEPGDPGWKPAAGRGKFPWLPVAGALAVPLILPGSGSRDNEAERFTAQAKVDRGEMTQEHFDRLWNHPGLKGVEVLLQRSFGKDMRIAVKDGVAKLPDSAMMSPLVDTATRTLPPILTAIEATSGKASAQLQKQSEALSAIRAMHEPLRQFAGKNLSTTVVAKINVPVSVSVGVSETQYRTRSFTQTVGGYDNSAGI